MCGQRRCGAVVMVVVRCGVRSCLLWPPHSVTCPLPSLPLPLPRAPGGCGTLHPVRQELLGGPPRVSHAASWCGSRTSEEPGAIGGRAAGGGRAGGAPPPGAAASLSAWCAPVCVPVCAACVRVRVPAEAGGAGHRRNSAAATRRHDSITHLTLSPPPATPHIHAHTHTHIHTRTLPPPQIDLGQLYAGVPPGTMYRLRAMVLLLRPPLLRLCAPAGAGPLGHVRRPSSASSVGAWAEVRRRCETGRVQPSVLFLRGPPPEGGGGWRRRSSRAAGGEGGTRGRRWESSGRLAGGGSPAAERCGCGGEGRVQRTIFVKPAAEQSGAGRWAGIGLPPGCPDGALGHQFALSHAVSRLSTQQLVGGPCRCHPAQPLWAPARPKADAQISQVLHYRVACCWL